MPARPETNVTSAAVGGPLEDCTVPLDACPVNDHLNLGTAVIDRWRQHDTQLSDSDSAPSTIS